MMANSNLTDYGKLAYTKVQELEKQIAQLQSKLSDTVTGQMVVPQMALSGGGIRNARILASKDCVFDVRIETYCYSANGTMLTATLFLDGDVVDEMNVRADAGGESFSLLLSSRYVKKGEHDVKVQLSANDTYAVASGIIIDVIGADVSVIFSAGKLELARLGDRDVGLILENEVARMFVLEGDRLEYVVDEFPYVKDACLCVHGEGEQTQIALLTVSRSGRAFVRKFNKNFIQTGYSYMGAGYNAVAATTHGDTMQVIFIKNGRFFRGVYDWIKGVGASRKRRESEWVSEQISLIADGNKIRLASQNQGAIKLFETPPQAETAPDALAFIMQIQEGEYTNA